MALATKWAVLDGAGNIINVVLWDGDVNKWVPPVGCTVEALADDDLRGIASTASPIIVSKRDAAIDALLLKESLDPLAPQEVKDYVGEKIL